MRLFVALELPEQVMDALKENSEALSEKVEGKFVNPKLFHVTLAFLGHVEDQYVDLVSQTVERACKDIHPFDAEMSELGHFGKRREATLWQGFEDPTPMEDASKIVRGALAGAGITFDGKPMVAHVTYARKVDCRHTDIKELDSELSLAGGTIDTVTLFESKMVDQKLTYIPVKRVKLIPAI